VLELTIRSLGSVTDRKRLEAERRSAVEVEEAHLRRRAEFAEEKKKEADEQKYVSSSVLVIGFVRDRELIKVLAFRLTRRHQEFLVSVVSHEVRNPVSAILQCAGLCSSNLTCKPTFPNLFSSASSHFPYLCLSFFSSYPNRAVQRSRAKDSLRSNVGAHQPDRRRYRRSRVDTRDGSLAGAYRERCPLARQDPTLDSRSLRHRDQSRRRSQTNPFRFRGGMQN
jgi:signal transduction histidine kinase